MLIQVVQSDPLVVLKSSEAPRRQPLNRSHAISGLIAQGEAGLMISPPFTWYFKMEPSQIPGPFFCMHRAAVSRFLEEKLFSTNML